MRSAARSARAQTSIAPAWAWNRSTGSIDRRRSFASKFTPPVVKPPACRMAYSASATSGTLFGNWSVSQPSSRSPRFMSTLPKMPNASAIAISCSKVWPASVE